MSARASVPALGLGIGWRPELALAIDRRTDLGFVEVVAEWLDAGREIPDALEALRERGLAIVPHGISLSLGGAERLDRARARKLGKLAAKLGSPFASEHVCFVRSGGHESGHLLPLPRTRDALAIVAENVRVAQEELGCPLALENVASLVEWPGNEMSEPAFLAELIDRTGALLLLDVANLHANSRNHGFDALAFLDEIPLEKIAYVHIAGGTVRGGLYHDTHAHPVPEGPLAILEALAARVPVPAYMLERDDAFPEPVELDRELRAIAGAVARGRSRREVTCA